MKFSVSVFSFVAAAVLLTACNNVDFKKSSAGVPYKVYSSSKGDSVKQNFFVKYEVVQKVKDSVLYSSYAQKQSEYVQVQPIFNVIKYTDTRSNVMEIMTKTKVGDSVYMTQATDSFLKENPQNVNIKKGEQIVTTLRIVAIYKSVDEVNAAYMKDNEPRMKEAIANAEKQDADNLVKFRADTAAQAQIAKDDRTIEAYLAAHKIQATKTPWGVYMQTIAEGSGPKPGMGKYAMVKYSGSHLNGTTFDSGTYPLQIGTPGSIKGFEDAVKQLSKGGKAKAFIPSTLAYGPQGRQGSTPKEPGIKPNEILVFDLELLEISDTPPQQAPQPQGQPDPSGQR